MHATQLRSNGGVLKPPLEHAAVAPLVVAARQATGFVIDVRKIVVQ
jgi:hypothetical protein